MTDFRGLYLITLVYVDDRLGAVADDEHHDYPREESRHGVVLSDNMFTDL